MRAADCSKTLYTDQVLLPTAVRKFSAVCSFGTQETKVACGFKLHCVPINFYNIYYFLKKDETKGLHFTIQKYFFFNKKNGGFKNSGKWK